MEVVDTVDPVVVVADVTGNDTLLLGGNSLLLNSTDDGVQLLVFTSAVFSFSFFSTFGEVTGGSVAFSFSFFSFSFFSLSAFSFSALSFSSFLICCNL